jgi:zinc/manganese transport system substrate-binding protein
MRISLFVFFTVFLIGRAEAKITVYACEPEWASLAREIVGKKAEVFLGTSPFENPANVRVTSSLLNVVRQADLIFCTGGGLEAKWLKRAIEEGNNIRVRTNPEATLLVYGAAGDGKKILPRPHLNPHNISKIAVEFTRKMKILDAVNADFYQKSYEDFAKKWDSMIQLWEKAALPLKGMRVVISDDSWLELTKWLGLEVAAKIDAQKSYIKNNQSLNEIVGELKKNPAKAIIFANYEDKKSILWLAEKTKTRVVLLPFTIGGAANSADLYQFFATTINSLLVDCSKSVCARLQIQPEVKR